MMGMYVYIILPAIPTNHKTRLWILYVLLWNSLFIFFFYFQHPREKYEKKVLGKSPKTILTNFTYISVKMHVFRPYLLHISYFIKIKKNGTVTWTISSNFWFILFPEVLKDIENLKKIYTVSFIKKTYKIHTRFLWFVGSSRPIIRQFKVTGNHTPDSGSFSLTYTQFKESV